MFNEAFRPVIVLLAVEVDNDVAQRMAGIKMRPDKAWCDRLYDEYRKLGRLDPAQGNYEVAHKNHDPLDMRSANLEMQTLLVNGGVEKHRLVKSMEKRGLPKGVYRYKRGLRAEIKIGNKKHTLSTYLADTPGNAAHLGELYRGARDKRDKELLEMATPTPEKNEIAQPSKKQCTIAELLRRR